MNKDINTQINKNLGYKENHTNINKEVKAVVLTLDMGHTVIVENDNYGTRRKYADFTQGKKKAGLHPLQIVFSGLDIEKALGGEYIGKDNKIHNFKEWN